MNLFSYPRAHILIAVTLSYILGILLSSYLSIPSHIYLLFFISIAAAFLISVKRSSVYTALVLALLFFLVIGHYRSGQSRLPPDSPDHISRHIESGGKEEVIAIGTIQRLYGYNGRSSRCDVEVNSLRTAESQFKWTHGIVRFTLLDIFPIDIVPGTTVAIRAKLNKPYPPLIPGNFNYPKYLANQGIHVTGFINSPLHIQKVVRSKGEINGIQSLRYWPESIRTRVNRFIDASLEGDNSAIYKALLTGDRSSISPEVIEHFKGAGVLHILAISGLHMSLLGVFSYAVCFYLLRRSTWLIHRINTRKTAAILCILPLLFYTLIAGAKTPVFRSFIMSLVVIIAICYGRKHSFGSLLACAALVILLLSPAELATPSFQLSFAAVIAIATAAPFISTLNKALMGKIGNMRVFGILKWVVVGVMISLAATLGTAPLLMYHFNRMSLVGVAANLIVEPMLCLWSLILGFIAIVFMFVWQSAAVILFQLGGLGISMASDATTFFYELPHSFVFRPSPSTFHIILYYSFLCTFFFLPKSNLRLKLAFSTCFIFLFMTMFLQVNELTEEKQNESILSYLAVGHGSSTLLEIPGGRRILIDAGALSSPGYDIGRSAIAPFLFTKRIRKIDDIVITHSDSDHYNGAAFLIQHFSVDNLWISSKENQEKGWQDLLNKAAATGTNIIVGKPQQYIDRGEKFSLKVLANTSNNDTSRSDNNRGLVLKYSHNDFSALFPGDISWEVENKLVESDLDLNANILLAAHHGSASSNSMQFLEAVDPELVIVSSSRSSSYSFPSAEVAGRCRKLGIPLVPLNTVGTITITPLEEGYSMESHLQDSSSNTLQLPASFIHR